MPMFRRPAMPVAPKRSRAWQGLAGALAAMCVSAGALAQSSPGLIPGQVVTDGTGRLTNATAPQWNAYFAGKQNYSANLNCFAPLTPINNSFPYFTTGLPGCGLGTFGAGLSFSMGVLSVTGFSPGTILLPQFGGTGINNGSSTITLGGPLITSGAISFGAVTTVGDLLTVTSSGVVGAVTPSVALGSDTANKVYATPDGSTGAGGYRALVNADLPSAITGKAINNTSIGLTTPAASAFTSTTMTGAITSTQTVSSLPSDLSKVNYVATQNVSSTLGAPSTFTVIDKASAINLTLNQFGGYNKNTGDGNASSGVFSIFSLVNTDSSTLGASGGYFVNVPACSGSMPGATDALANPSCQTVSGQVFLGTDGNYAQGSGDFLVDDGGHYGMGIGLVIRLDRSVIPVSPSLGTTWEGVTSLSQGSASLDSLFHGAGVSRILVDGAAWSSPGGDPFAAMTIPAGAGIFFNSTISATGSGIDCTATAVSAGRSVCTVPGTVSISGGSGTLNFDTDNAGTTFTSLSLSATLATLNVTPQFVFSTTGSGTQTFTNSPCSVTATEEWIPIKINGKAHTYYMPACDAGF